MKGFERGGGRHSPVLTSPQFVRECDADFLLSFPNV